MRSRAIEASVLVVLSCLAFQPSWVRAADGKKGVNPYGKVFIGTDVTVEMALFEEKNKDGLNDVLMRITGGPAHEEGIDGKVLKYTAVHGGNGVDFKYESKGQTYNRMSSRSSWGSWQNVEVYVSHKTDAVVQDAKKSKELKTKDLWNEFQKNK